MDSLFNSLLRPAVQMARNLVLNDSDDQIEQMRGDREEEEVGQGGEEEEDNNEESIRSDVASSERSDTSVHQSNESGTGRTSGSTRRSSSRSGSTSGGREQSGETNTGGEVCLILNIVLEKCLFFSFQTDASEQASFVDELPNDLLSTRSARSRSPPRGESGVTTAISNSETNTALGLSPARRRAWDNEYDDVKTARVCQSEENLLASVGTFKC
ncbi:unnamed protein product [Meloidogyne enterolobii]|uniref:Uncharacterized protein n=1 Tax=Meloidogyne enterolobii TaxID=390850 RepID=A0ACB0XLE6_MELEN